MTPGAMRICHVSPHLPPDQAANALLPATLGAWSRARGDEVTFVAHEPAQGAAGPDEAHDRLPGPVERVRRHRPRTAVSRLLKIATLRTARDVREGLERAAAGADLLHLHSNGVIIEVAAAWARRRGLPTVLTLYGTEIWHYRPRRIIDPFRRAYDAASAVTFYSQGLLDHARQLGLGRPGLTVVYPAVREAFRPQSDETRRAWREALGISEPLVVLNVKRLHRLAGQDVLLDAFAEVCRARQDVRLVICGTGPARDALERQAGALAIADRVTFTGLVANDEVARYAAVADLFALPSRLEALPTVAVEALAAGTPVVSADHPGGLELHALFGDDVQLVPGEEPAGLAAAIAVHLAAPRRASAATMAMVAARFGPDAVRAAYAEVYGRALAARRRV